MFRVKWAIGFLFIACLSINLSFTGALPFTALNSSWAEQRDKQIRGTKDGVIVKREMYVMGKNEKGVVISEELFRILPSTVILDTKGRKITLRELEVPSTAFVEYSLNVDGSPPTIISIEVLRESRKSIERRRGGGRIRSIKEYEVK